jgi:outer membrane phospholipase A
MEKPNVLRFRGVLLAVIVCVSWIATARGENVSVTVTAATNAVSAGGPAEFYLVALNVTDQPAAWVFPAEIPCRLASSQDTAVVRAHLVDDAETNAVILAPGTFACRPYALKMPELWTGEVTAKFDGLSPARLVFDVQNPPATVATGPARESLVMRMLKGSQLTAGEKFDPGLYFKQHIFGYQPMYFIAGTKSPNAKFQISFKYRVFNEEGWPADSQPWLTGFYVAYTQQSLWDWNTLSAPFYDTSYMPEFLYSWDHLERFLGGSHTNWLRLDLATGLHHESNGKSGTDSRSMNYAFLSPALTLGYDDGLQLKLTPRAWVYLGDLSDNPDIADYRGYVSLCAVVGWQRGLQLSALIRMGRDGGHAGYEFDATWPLMQPPGRSFSAYLQVQYYHGYGESLLGYNQKTDELRAGFSIWR